MYEKFPGGDKVHIKLAILNIFLVLMNKLQLSVLYFIIILNNHFQENVTTLQLKYFLFSTPVFGWVLSYIQVNIMKTS